MKKYISALAVLLLLPLSPVLAFTWTSPLAPEPGSAGDPFHVLIEPTQSYKNDTLEASLKAQYGSSAYYSCMNRVPSCNGDTSDPRTQTACLQAIQYGFESGRCGVSSSPNLTCQAGFTMVNGSCVRETTSYPVFPIIQPTTQQGPTCGDGTLLVGNKCVSYNESCRITYGAHTYGDKDSCYCDAGYEWSTDNKSCIPATFHGSITIGETTGLTSNGGSGGSGSAGGGSSGGSYEAPDYNQGCKDRYGTHSYWDGTFDEENAVSCVCESGHYFDATTNTCLATAVEPESHAASLALLANWDSDHQSEEPVPQPERRSFWSWLLGLFGL